MSLIDEKTIEQICESIASRGSHNEKEPCDHCKIMHELCRIKCMHVIYENLLNTALKESINDCIFDAVAIGFCLAYDYMEIKNLEEKVK